MLRKLRIGLYARVSSEIQAQEGTIDSQIESIKLFVESIGGIVEPDLLFMDNGVSGTSFSRPALDALRDKADAGEIDRVYILRAHPKTPHIFRALKANDKWRMSS